MKKLSEKDIKFLKAEIVQILLAYILIIIILSIVFFAGYLLIQKLDNIENKNTAIIFLSITLSGGLFLFFFRSLHKPIKDITSGQKTIIKGRLSNKSTSTNYAYSQNAIADFTTQPKLVEHFITVENTTYLVTEEQYNNLSENDIVQISFSSNTNKILDIE